MDERHITSFAVLNVHPLIHPPFMKTLDKVEFCIFFPKWLNTSMHISFWIFYLKRRRRKLLTTTFIWNVHWGLCHHAWHSNVMTQSKERRYEFHYQRGFSDYVLLSRFINFIHFFSRKLCFFVDLRQQVLFFQIFSRKFLFFVDLRQQALFWFKFSLVNFGFCKSASAGVF